MNWRKIRFWGALIIGAIMVIGQTIFLMVKFSDPEVQRRMLTWKQNHPFSAFDYVLGFLTAAMLFGGFYIWEIMRFSRDVKQGDDDGGPGETRLPFTNKVIPIEDVRRIWRERHGQ